MAVASIAMKRHAVRVGILDTGVAGTVLARSEFKSPNTETWPAPAVDNHASQLADIIVGLCPNAQILDARAFVQGRPSSAAQIAAALEWLTEEQAAVVNMSFGLYQNRSVLADAIGRAADAGVLLVASSPAAGTAVYPAACAGVLAITGDARCDPGVYADFAGGNLDFGAAPGGLQHSAHQAGGGASFACAHVSGALAQLLDSGCPAQDAVTTLRKQCRFRGREF